jgi:type II secretory ATPase GspE/PulE/Tfp pilus assembly ATPase PilB-like protein
VVRYAQVPEGSSFYRGKGCRECGQSGYSGRIALFELVLFDDALRSLVLSGQTEKEMRAKIRIDLMAKANGKKRVRKRISLKSTRDK